MKLVHLAILGETRGLCGSAEGEFTVSEQAVTCQDCLHIEEPGHGYWEAGDY